MAKHQSPKLNDKSSSLFRSVCSGQMSGTSADRSAVKSCCKIQKGRLRSSHPLKSSTNWGSAIYWGNYGTQDFTYSFPAYYLYSWDSQSRSWVFWRSSTSGLPYCKAVRYSSRMSGSSYHLNCYAVAIHGVKEKTEKPPVFKPGRWSDRVSGWMMLATLHHLCSNNRWWTVTERKGTPIWWSSCEKCRFNSCLSICGNQLGWVPTIQPLKAAIGM